MTAPFIHLNIASAKWKNAFPKIQVKIERAAEAAFLRARKPAAFAGRRFQIDVILTDDATIRRLNKDWRGYDKPTNVLSFPQLDIAKLKRNSLDIFPPPAPIPLGDVLLAFQTILKEGKEHEKSLENHTVHLVVHGTLHLLGYDHVREKDARAMGKMECDILETLGYPDPYHETP